MDLDQITSATAAWIETWLHGNAHPRVVLAALSRLASQATGDPRAIAVVERGRRTVASAPFGSVPHSLTF